MKMKKIFLDLDGTLARFNVRNALERFATEKGFFAKLKAYTEYDKFKKRSLERLSQVEIHFIENFEKERKRLDK